MLYNRSRTTITILFIFAIISVFFIKGDWVRASDPDQSKSLEPQGQVLARTDQSGQPWLNLQDGYESRTVYQGKENSLISKSDDVLLKPLSLYSADINRDGFPDLVSGHATATGGLVSIRFGDPEAFGPTRPETIEGIKNGHFPPSFLPNAAVYSVPEAPDFLSVSDFDRDGRLDILTAARGSSQVNLLSENLENQFGVEWKLSLPGQITTLATGRDVLTPYEDLAIGINSESGGQVLFYSTAKSILEETPAVYKLLSAANSIAIGQLDEKVPTDLAVATANEVLVIHGTDSKNLKGTSKSFYQSQIENLQILPKSNLVIGDFVPDRENRMELAVLSGDGTIHIQSRGQLDTRPFTKEEILEKRRKMAEMRESGNFGIADFSPWQPDASESWREAQTMYVGVPAQDAGSPIKLFAGGNIAASGGEELLVVNSNDKQVKILMNDSDPMTGNMVSSQRTSMAIDVEVTPIAVLPMRLGVIGQPGLVVLSKERTNPIVMQAAPQATFDVDRIDDTAAASACGAAANDCSMRGAILAANGNGVGADLVTFSANTPTLTVIGNDNTGAGGDLDINSNLTVMGNGAATTIISTTYTAAGTNDHKVFGVNPDGFSNSLGVSFSGLTVQNGFNRAPCGTFFETGGGGDFFLTGTGNNYSMTNTIVHNNNADNCPASRGGGINVDSMGSASVGGPLLGTVTITGSTFTRNISDAEGGGLNLAADKHDVVVTNSTFGGANPADGNQTQNAGIPANGGGIDIEHSFGGTITINGTTTVQNNTAARAGGGINITFNPNVMISGNVTISNNTSNSSGGGSAAGGGVAINPIGIAGFTPTISLTGCTINNNVATAGATGQGGGVYFNSFYSATINNCSISGNSADRGGGVFNGGSSATPAAVLTINNGSLISNNSATGPGGGVANIDSTGANTVLNGITINNNTSGSGADGIDQTLDGAGTGSTMTLQGTVNVNGGDSIFIGRGTFNSTSGTLNLTGDFTRNAGTTFNNNGGTVNFNGTGAQAIDGTASTTFNNLTDSNTNALLNVNTNTNVNGNLTVNANATLNPAAATVIGGTGTLTGNGTARVTRTAATADFLSQYTITNKTLTNLLVDYVGTSAQTVSAINYGGLRLNNVNGANLANGTTNVSGNLILTNGVLTTGANVLTVTNTGSLARTNGFVNGNLRKDFTTLGLFTFAVGTASGYAPVDVNVTAGTGNLTVNGINGPMPFINGSQALQRYWNLTGGGITANLVFNYNQTDVLGNESQYTIHRQALPSNFTVSFANQCPGSPCVDTVNNQARIDGIVNFSNWTAAVRLAPTAASAIISGRVLSPEGRGVARARVLITDTDGTRRTVSSNQFGYYRIRDVEAGETYTVSVLSKRYRFTPRVISVFDNINGFDFIAEP